MEVQFDSDVPVPKRQAYDQEIDTLMQIPVGKSYLFGEGQSLHQSIRAKIWRKNREAARKLFATAAEGGQLRVWRLR